MKQPRKKPKNPPNLYLVGDSWMIDFMFRGERYRESLGPVSRTVAKEEVGKRKAAAAEGRLDTGRKVKDLPFPDALEKYLEYYKANRRPSSHVRHVNSGVHLKAFFGTSRLSAISAFAIERYKRERKEAKAADATINREMALLKNLFNLSMKWGFARKNPVCEVKQYRLDNSRTRYLTEEELGKLLEACNPNLRIVVLTAVHTGLRTSELKSLTWRLVDFRNRSLTVESAYSKNGETRSIPLNAVLTEELKRLRIDNRPTPEDSVFLNRTGRPWKCWRTAFKTALKRAGISDFKFHDSRHSFGSYLAMADVNEKARMELMGHKDPKMTMRYTHLSLDYKRAAVAKLEKLGTGVPTNLPIEETSQGEPKLQVVENTVRARSSAG